MSSLLMKMGGRLVAGKRLKVKKVFVVAGENDNILKLMCLRNQLS